MKVSPFAGKPTQPAMLVNVAKLVTAYYSDVPDPAMPEQRVVFGTSGHRGSALNRSFNEAHIVAITQAICSYRKGQQTTGPLFLGMDTTRAVGTRQSISARSARGKRRRGDG